MSVISVGSPDGTVVTVMGGLGSVLTPELLCVLSVELL